MSLHDPDYFQACDVRRLGHRPCFRQTDSLAARRLHEGVKCYGFFGSGDKNQSTTNTQIGASEDADLIYATGSNVAGQGGTLLQGSNVLGGVSLGGANSGSITINGNAGVKEATEQFAELLNNVSDGARETVTTTGVFYVRPGGGSDLEQNAGRTFGDQSNEFSSLTFYNRTGTAINAYYYVGSVPYQPDPSVVAAIASLSVTVSSIITHKATTTLGSGIVALASGASSATITNVNGKQFAVRSHTTSVGNLQIKDGSGNIMDVLAPGNPAWTLETSGSFILTASGGACDYSWAKVIYA